jgi:type I restriction enzyme S subunit
MSKIDDLIEKFCPDGVESKSLAELFKISRGRVISKDNLNLNKGRFPVYSSQTARDGMIGSIDTYDYEGEYLTWTTDGANAGTIFYRNGKFSITNVCGLLKTKDYQFLNPKFAFYTLSVYMKRYVNYGMGNPKLMSNVVEKIRIPIPPLPVQEEIVNILDKFTSLKAELEAELENRIKQYEYCRDKLLVFEGKVVEWRSLGELASYSKDRISAKLLDLNSYVGVDNLLQNKQGKTHSSYVPTTGNLTGFKKNDILIGNIRPYLKKIWHSNLKGGTNGDVLVIRINDEFWLKLSSEYLFYLLSSDSFFEYNMRHAKGAKMPRGDKDSILKYTIPIPPIEEQNRIVAILDKFDALVNDISTGLPAEIKARRQQYEHYRGKLLTFNEQ